MNSCIYLGKVRHRRLRPRRHEFSYRLFMMYLDLAELDTVFRGRWLWSTTSRWAPVQFRREDHFGDPQQPLDDCVRELVAQETGRRPEGPIRLLAHLRYFGYCFNPISVFYCFDQTGSRLETIVAEVCNTPWGERCCYVLDATSQPRDRQQRYRFAKSMHVSPFMPMNLDYAWYCNQPNQRLQIHMNVLQADDKLFDATLNLRRRPLSGGQLASVLAGYPLMTLKVIAAIHWQAIKLWLKQVPLFDHPSKKVKPLKG